MVITLRIQNTMFCLHLVVRFALDNIFVRVLTVMRRFTLRGCERAGNSKQA